MKNVFWHDGEITREDRNRLNGHGSALLWFTGLPSSGKSTIAHALEKVLFERGIRCYVLDGDNIRHGLCSDLGFSREDRKENLRRIAEVARLMVDAGLVVLAAFVSPYQKDREYVRKRFEKGLFYEIYVKCSVTECERRDPKGLYQKAKKGIIKEYTGISAPYEVPENPDLVLDTEKQSLEECVKQVLYFMERIGLIPEAQ